MSSGQHHAGMTKGIASGITLGAVFSYFLTPIEITFVALGCLIGLFLTPDADVDGGNISNHYVRSVSGKWGETIWDVIWNPYRRAIKHRSFWSHTPIIGTVIRLMYCIFPVIIILLKDQNSTSYFELIPKTFLAQFVVLPFVAIFISTVYILYTVDQVDLVVLGLALFVGLAVSDFGHWVLDM